MCTVSEYTCAGAMAVGWTTEEIGALDSIWGQANVQNEL